MSLQINRRAHTHFSHYDETTEKKVTFPPNI
jgi:hypothetical protein